jgi:hypothetical protein
MDVLEPVALEDILALSLLPPFHLDPFDRLKIAQANRRIGDGFVSLRTIPNSPGYHVAVLVDDLAAIKTAEQGKPLKRVLEQVGLTQPRRVRVGPFGKEVN